MINDDYTPMDFVVHVLQKFFHMDERNAVAVMLTIHNRGVAQVGVFTFEMAETKISQVTGYARQREHPLQCRMEAI